MNGAAEAILEDLLKQAQITNSQLANMLKQGASTGGSGGGGTASFVKGVGLAAVAVTAVAGVFNVLGNAIGYVTGVIGQTASKMVDFGKAAAEGRAQLSDLFRVFDQLPLVGKLFDLFAQVVSYQENLLRSYQDLAKSGASFSGSLFEMRNMAYSAYMTLDEFGRVVKDNSSLFATAIGGVDAGLKIFSETQRKLIDPNSNMGRSLAGLGVTAMEAADMLGTFMRLQGNMGRLNKMGSDAMAASTKGLIVQLDAYSKLTGESREVMEKQLKDRAFDDQKKMFLEALNPTERAQAEAALLAASQMGGKGLEDEVAVRLMSNNQIKVAGTEAANSLRVTTRNASATAADILAGLKDLKPGSEEAVAALQAARGNIAQGTGQFNQAVGGAGRAGILSFFGALKFSTEQAKTYNQTMSELNGNQISDEDRRKKILEAQKKQYEGNAAALQAAQLQIRMFGAALGASFLTLVSKLQPAIDTISKRLLEVFGGAVTALTEPGGPMDKVGKFLEETFVPMFEDVVAWFTDTLGYLSSAGDMKTFWSRAGEKLKEGATNIWEFIKPAIDIIKPMIANVFASMMDWIIAALRNNSAIARFLFNETDTEKEQRIKIEASPEYTKLLNDAQEKVNNENAAAIAAGGFSMGFIDRDDILKQAKAQMEANAKASSRPKMSTGTLGTMGSLFADFGKKTEVELHGKEAVVTPAQMDSIVNNSMAMGLETLNMQVAELIRTNKEMADYARRNVDATRSLSGDLFAM
jgi:membrane protein YqaA with SNARE-associated domain